MRPLARIALAAFAALALAAGAASDPLRSPRLLGEAGGLRPALEGAGVGLQLFYTQFLSANPSGGANPRSTGHSGSYDLLSLVDVEELVGWRGLTALLHVRGQYDRNINDEVGAFGDPIDDADFDEAIYLDRLWLEQGLFEERLRIRVGFMEQQTVFDRNGFADSEDIQFMNAFLDNNPLVPLPNALGVVVLFRPTGRFTLAAAVSDADNRPRQAGFDSAFDGFSSLSAHLEAAFAVALPGPRGLLPGMWRLGIFRDGRERPRVDGDGSTRGHPGVYVSLEQQLLRESDPAQGLGLFVRSGWTDGAYSPLEWFWSFGASYTGLLRSRDRDELGLAAYQALGSSRSELDYELGVELYYRLQLLPWLAVTPDLQWIRDPGARGENRDAWVTSLRLRVAF